MIYNWLPYDKSIRKFQFEKEITLTSGLTHAHSIHAYYPVNRYGSEVDAEIHAVRNLIYSFKEGRSTDFYVDLFYDAVTEKFNISDKERSVLIPIPASTYGKTLSRFSVFNGRLANRLGIDNGFNYVRWADHDPTHLGGTANRGSLIEIEKDKVRGKKIFLLDDVVTRGHSFMMVGNRLLAAGAMEVTGLFLAHTTSREKHGTQMLYEGIDYYFDDRTGSYHSLEDFYGLNWQ